MKICRWQTMFTLRICTRTSTWTITRTKETSNTKILCSPSCQTECCAFYTWKYVENKMGVRISGCHTAAFGKGEYQLQTGPYTALFLLYWKPFLIILKSTPASTGRSPSHILEAGVIQCTESSGSVRSMQKYRKGRQYQQKLFIQQMRG